MITLAPGETREINVQMTPIVGGIALLVVVVDAEFGQSSYFDGTVTAISNVTGVQYSQEASGVGRATFTSLEEGNEYTIIVSGASALFPSRNLWRIYYPYSVTCVPSELPLLETGEHYLRIAIPPEYVYAEGPMS